MQFQFCFTFLHQAADINIKPFALSFLGFVFCTVLYSKILFSHFDDNDGRYVLSASCIKF